MSMIFLADQLLGIWLGNQKRPTRGCMCWAIGRDLYGDEVAGVTHWQWLSTMDQMHTNSSIFLDVSFYLMIHILITYLPLVFSGYDVPQFTGHSNL